MKNKLFIIILAAGKGTRMKSDLPKVLNLIGNTTMIERVILKTNILKPDKVIIVVGYKENEVREALRGYHVEFVLQKNQLGTGHAIMECKEKLGAEIGHTMILSGDVPMITQNTLDTMYEQHVNNKNDLTLLTANMDNSSGYGRIIKKNDKFIGIVEEKDASDEQRKITEINAGIYIFNNRKLMENIFKVKNNNAQSEYYLPDVIPFILKMNGKIEVKMTKNIKEIKGVNTIEQLSELNT